MKKYLSLAMLLCTAFAFCLTGCGKDKKAESQEPAENAGDFNESYIGDDSESSADYAQSGETVNTNERYVSAVSIYTNAGVFVKDPSKEDKLRWVGALTKGQCVFAEGLGDINEYEMNFIGDKEGAKKTVMARVLIDCDESNISPNAQIYYVVKANLVYGTATFVVVGDNLSKGKDYTYIYSEPNLKKITSKKVPSGTLIAVHDWDGPDHEFYEATFYIPEGESKGLYRNKYLEAGAITCSKQYVDAAMMNDRLNNLKDRKDGVYETVFDTVGSDDSEEFSDFRHTIGFIDER